MENESGIVLEAAPFLKMKIVRWGDYGVQGICNVIIGIFSVYIVLCYGAGWSIGPNMGKWNCGLRIHLKRIIIGIDWGIDVGEIAWWKAMRNLRKLSPAKIEQLKKILSELGV